MRHITKNSSGQASDVERGTVEWMGGRRFLEAEYMTAPFAIRSSPDQKACPKGSTGFREPCRTTGALAMATMSPTQT